jgi:hypothetical protein
MYRGVVVTILDLGSRLRSASRPAALPQGKIPRYTLDGGLPGPHSWTRRCRVEKTLTRNSTLGIWTAARPYTESHTYPSSLYESVVCILERTACLKALPHRLMVRPRLTAVWIHYFAERIRVQRASAPDRQATPHFVTSRAPLCSAHTQFPDIFLL